MVPTSLSERDVEAALQACADEPVHIPGMIQPFGWLVAYETESGRVSYASDNLADLVGQPASQLPGLGFRDIFGAEFWHAVQNALAARTGSDHCIRAGEYAISGTVCEVSVFESGGHVVVELEKVDDDTSLSADSLQQLGFLIDTIEACQSEPILFETTAKLLQLFSAYDRVMVYKFDLDFNGEVLADARKTQMAPMLGLRFPHWDIPAQAREIMRRVPLRFISDVDQDPVPLLAAEPGGPGLDITHAFCRGVSTVHLQYLRNMGSHATMTLSVTLDGELWGIISFHHRQAKTPSPQLRYVLREFRKAFQLKLHLLRERALLQATQALESINASIHNQVSPAPAAEELVIDIGPKILALINAHGIALLSDSHPSHLGRVPRQAVLEQLSNDVQSDKDGILVIDHLSERYPELADDLNGCAGTLVIAYPDNLVLCAFRDEVAQSVQWAGNPEKTIETVDGMARLAPRGSFSTYLETIVGKSEPWTDQDVYLFKQLWTVLSVADRRAQFARMNRQQALMIDELNHRVRNILALVRAVSNQARTHYGSLNSYSKALEARIYSLAAAHDIGSGSAAAAISIQRIIHLELDPYASDNPDRVTITGCDRNIRADMGPIFALIIHELTTNAAKYGSLSTTEGRVDVQLSIDDEKLVIHWKERGGPAVAEPTKCGFGTALIEQAVPYELGGSSSLDFAPSGVEASIQIPHDILGDLDSVQDQPAAGPADVEDIEDIPDKARDTQILVLEDNFMIATDMRSELEKLGFDKIELCSSSGEALVSLSSDRPDVAFLDINLGGGRTSADVAAKLLKIGVPFVFVTGYGDRTNLPEALGGVQRLTKPISKIDLQRAILAMLTKLRRGAAEGQIAAQECR